MADEEKNETEAEEKAEAAEAEGAEEKAEAAEAEGTEEKAEAAEESKEDEVFETPIIEGTDASAAKAASTAAGAENPGAIAAAMAKLGKDITETEGRGRDRRLVGRVVNDTNAEGRAKKTVVVEVVRRMKDPFYGKYVKRKKKYHAHDETQEYKIRDLVEIKASRPHSKTKRWVVSRLLERPPEV